MELSSCMSFPAPPPRPSPLFHQNLRRLPLPGRRAAPPRRTPIRGAARRYEGYGGHYGGRLVDEYMIVLRKRVHEMEVKEMGDEAAAPSHWAEWEKRYYCGRYGADVCDVVAALQRLLLNSRPAVALAVGALVAVGVPTTAAVFTFNLAAAIAGGLHLG